MSSETRQRHEVWNQLCDADELWGPLVFLRPAADREFSHARLALVTCLFGFFYGMCANIMLAWIHHLVGWRGFALPVLPLSLAVGAFICGELTFLPAWNSRARLALRRAEFERRMSKA